MTSIDELLAKLRKLDPDTCCAFDTLFEEIYGICIQGESVEWSTFAGSTYLLQGVIQDAIAARGWIFSIEYLSYAGDDNCSALIGYDLDEGKTLIDFGDSPIIALLKAYIAALEATR